MVIPCAWMTPRSGGVLKTYILIEWRASTVTGSDSANSSRATQFVGRVVGSGKPAAAPDTAETGQTVKVEL